MCVGILLYIYIFYELPPWPQDPKFKSDFTSRELLILWLFSCVNYFVILYIMRNVILPLRVMYYLYTPLKKPPFADGNRLSSANQNGGYDPTYIMRLKLHRAYGSEESIKRHSVTQPPSCVLNAITAHHPHQHTRIHGWTGGYPSVSPFSPSGPRSSLVM